MTIRVLLVTAPRAMFLSFPRQTVPRMRKTVPGSNHSRGIYPARDGGGLPRAGEILQWSPVQVIINY